MPAEPPAATTTFDLEMVSTGAELLNGRSVNTHARWLGGRMEDLGFRLRRETTVGDDPRDIADAVRAALARVPIVVVSGGLGPTCDDLTRDAVAGLLGRGLVLDEPSLERMRRRYAAVGREMTESRRRQALIVEGAAALSNSAGAAPGERIETDGRILFLLPGPPKEFHAIVEQHVIPWLRERFPDLRPPARAVFQLCGVPESDAVERLAAAGFSPGPLDLAYCASPGNLEVRLTGRPEDGDLVAAKADAVRRIFHEDIYSEGREDLAAVVVRSLAAAGETVAVAESCTGGGLGRRLTSVPGSSAVFRGGIVAYANDLKERLLGVPADVLAREGAVSAATAEHLAAGVRERLGATWGVAVTGVAGPDGGTPDKPVGQVFIAVAGAAGARARGFRFIGDREQIRVWTEQYALDALRRRRAADGDAT